MSSKIEETHFYLLPETKQTVSKYTFMNELPGKEYCSVVTRQKLIF